MKIKKINKYQNKLLKLRLIKTKIYKNQHQFNSIQIEDIEYRLKKALHIIHKFHTNNKKILFIGIPIKIHKKLKQLLNNTKHIYIPESIWIDGIITNRNACFKYLSKNSKSTINKNKVSKLLTKLKNKSDLIVIFDKSLDHTALNESYVTRLPIISFNYNLDIFETKSSYKIPGNFKFTKKK